MLVLDVSFCFLSDLSLSVADLPTNAKRERNHGICAAKKVSIRVWIYIAIVSWEGSAKL